MSGKNCWDHYINSRPSPLESPAPTLYYSELRDTNFCNNSPITNKDPGCPFPWFNNCFGNSDEGVSNAVNPWMNRYADISLTVTPEETGNERPEVSVSRYFSKSNSQETNDMPLEDTLSANVLSNTYDFKFRLCKGNNPAKKRVQAIKEFFTGPDANDYDNDSKFREMFLGPKITNRSERTSRPSQRTFFSRMATQPAQYSKSLRSVRMGGGMGYNHFRKDSACNARCDQGCQCNNCERKSWFSRLSLSRMFCRKDTMIKKSLDKIEKKESEIQRLREEIRQQKNFVRELQESNSE